MAVVRVCMRSGVLERLGSGILCCCVKIIGKWFFRKESMCYKYSLLIQKQKNALK